MTQRYLCPLGLTYTTTDPEAVACLHDAFVAMLTYNVSPAPHLQKALELDPHFVMASVFKAFLLLTVGGIGADENVQESAKAINSQDRNDLTWRERRHVEAMERKLVNDEKAAVDIWEDILLKFPRDIYAIRAVNQAYIFLGDSVNIRDCIARILPAWDESMTCYPHLLSMYSFGLEESGLMSKAIEVAERSLSLNPALPWAFHALSHVYGATESPERGIDLLIKSRKHWVEGGLSVHMTWHLCLCYLDAGDLDAALKEYDTVLKVKVNDIAGFVDAVSLLWRIECTGIDIGEERWAGLIEKVREYSNRHSMAWYDAHIMMALACRSAKDHAARLLLGRNLLQSLKDYGGSVKSHNAWVTNEVGIPLCEALLAFGNEEYEKTVSLILPIRYKCCALGWSSGQRHTFAITLIRAAMQAKNFSLARALLSEVKELWPKHKSTAKLYLQVMNSFV